MPDNINKAIFISELFSKYIKIKGDKIMLDDNIMLNLQNKLIFCNSNSITESGEKITIDFMKFLHFCKLSDRIIYEISTQDILIKKL